MTNKWMLYGAYGYTGELIARHAVEEGCQPLLAGRNGERTAKLANELGLQHITLSLDHSDELHEALAGVDAVVHAAGPFSRTSEPMVAACLATGTHYLDITGEISVFNAAFKAHEEAVAAAVVLLPGVGFDVIPTDAMAALLYREMPDATSLDLAFAGGGSASRGTLRTAIEGISQGGWIREDGRLKSVPTGWKSQEVAFADKPRNVVTIPWGDLATAYRSTGIPNIRTWMAVPRSSARWMRWSNPFKGVMGTRMAQGMLNRWIDGQAVGPDADTRATARSQVWGRVVNEAGKAMEGTLTTSEGYRFTALGAVAAVQRVAEATPGAHTPSTAFGADFASTIQGVTVGSFTLID